MPYVPAEVKYRITHGSKPFDSGTLTYLLTTIVDDYITEGQSRDISFAALADAIGALECTKLELYRRVAAPYEDAKREINGEAYSSRALKAVQKA